MTTRVLVVGAGGVGSAVVGIAARRDFFEAMVVADYDARRAEQAVAPYEDDGRFSAAAVDASSADAVADLVREHRATHVLNAVDPRFVMPIFDGTFAAGPTTSTWRCRCRGRIRRSRTACPV